MKQILNQCNRIWRLLATALGFILFGIGGLLVLSTLWFTVLRLFVWNKNKRTIIAQYSVYLCFKTFSIIIRFLGVIDYRFVGLDKLKLDKGCLVIANHPSLLDVVLLGSVMPRCDCIVKEALLNNIFMGGVIKTTNYIPNSKAEKMLPFCKQILQQEGRILIFPEGTRSVPNMPISLQRGAANIALRCHADIRVIHIECSPPMLIKKQKWYDIPSTKPFFNIIVGKKIAINDFYDDNTSVAARRLTEYLSSELDINNFKNTKN